MQPKLSLKLISLINQIFMGDNHLLFKYIACAIGYGHMASTLGGISQLEWQQGTAEKRFFLFIREGLTHMEGVPPEITQEVEDIIDFYRIL